jgi:hypothetical protein
MWEGSGYFGGGAVVKDIDAWPMLVIPAKTGIQ